MAVVKRRNVSENVGFAPSKKLSLQSTALVTEFKVLSNPCAQDM